MFDGFSERKIAAGNDHWETVLEEIRGVFPREVDWEVAFGPAFYLFLNAAQQVMGRIYCTRLGSRVESRYGEKAPGLHAKFDEFANTVETMRRTARALGLAIKGTTGDTQMDLLNTAKVIVCWSGEDDTDLRLIESTAAKLVHPCIRIMLFFQELKKT